MEIREGDFLIRIWGCCSCPSILIERGRTVQMHFRLFQRWWNFSRGSISHLFHFLIFLCSRGGICLRSTCFIFILILVFCAAILALNGGILFYHLFLCFLVIGREVLYLEVFILKIFRSVFLRLCRRRGECWGEAVSTLSLFAWGPDCPWKSRFWWSWWGRSGPREQTGR